jgi:hypothetical protein
LFEETGGLKELVTVVDGAAVDIDEDADSTESTDFMAFDTKLEESDRVDCADSNST